VSGSSLPPGVLRRKQLRQQRRADRLRDLWRLVVFSALAAGVGYGLLRQGWSLRDPAQVEVSGSRTVSREQVIQAAGLRFPQPLLALQPKQLSRDLESALPVEQVKVSRLMLPPRLRVELVDRIAVARAERRRPGGPESGYIDRQGNWISSRQSLGLPPRGDLSLLVSGWNERHRGALARVLETRGRFGPGLREIRFDPDGSLWLTTAELGSLRLGPVDDRLERRLEVAAHLNRTLPARIRGRTPQLIDLSDPEQPELSTAGAPKPAAPGGR
jgi:cell division protein FtsQ